MLKFPNLYIIPEKIIINETIPDLHNFQLRNLAKLFISNFIGGIINEYDFCDFWLISAIENWLVYNFMTKCYGNIYMKGLIIDTLNKYKYYCKNGFEKRSLYSNFYSHPIELQIDNIIYIKSLIVMILLESYIEKTYILKGLKNIINERSKSNTISTESFIKILKKNCGISLKKFTNLWIFKTGMVSITFNYTYKEDSNSINIEVYQKPLLMNHIINHPYIPYEEINKNINIQNLSKANKIPPIVDFRLKSNRYFDISLNITVFQTNGYEILKETHNILLDNDCEVSTKNIPLITKLRKGQIKKREQEFIQEIVSNTNITKLFSNEEIEKIMTKNSILWIRIDPEMTCLRTITNNSTQDILFEYIKLFKDPDIYSQYESLKAIYYKKDDYQNSMLILETFIKTQQNIYYKLRIYALEIYIKIIHNLKKEDGYILIVELLSDYYIEFTKNKSNLNKENYLIMKYLIKCLGYYKEDTFNEFNIIGKSKMSEIQKKIIDKLLIILLSNDLNSISNLNDSYIIRELLISLSKLELQDKIFYFLKKFLQLLRIEKLKRSFNDIIVISILESYINFLNINNYLIKNPFFNDPIISNILNSINEEINYFIQGYYNRQETGIMYSYFVVFMYFSKSIDSKEFIREVDNYIMNNSYSYSNQEESLLSSEEMYIKLHGFILFCNNHMHVILKESIINDIDLYIKSLLFKLCIYSRIDIRTHLQSIYRSICEKKNDNNKKDKHADETWLQAHINIIKEIHKINEKDDSENESEIGNIQGDSLKLKVIKYQSKYSDPYLVNYDLNLEHYSERDGISIILSKLNLHPLSEHFNYQLNEFSLGELYNSYFSIVKKPMDLETIKIKNEENQYASISQFISDMKLIFTNAKLFNDKRSIIYNAAIQFEEYFNILIYNLLKKEKKFELTTKISLIETEDLRDKERKNSNLSIDKLSFMEIDELNSEH